MRIGVDARHLAEGRGVARYTRGMLAALAQMYPGDEIVALVPGRGPIDLPAPMQRHNVRIVRTLLPGRAVFGVGALAGRPRLELLLKRAVDVVWLPAPAPVALAGEVPYVLTIHDLSFEQRPGDFTAYERAWHRAAHPRALATGAARVVAVSHATRDVVADHWRLDAARMRVVGQGVWGPGDHPRPRPAWLPKRYVLAVGALEPRKACGVLADAFALARHRGLDAELVFAGAGRLAGRLGRRPGVRVMGHVSADALDALYSHAIALAMPSYLEGFGLPPLEALSRGTPPVVADLPVYRETLGEAAVRVPPGDVEALAAALVRLDGDGALRARVLSAAPQALAPHTWSRAAAGLRAVLAEAAEAPA
jgi:glycosyltransferase involved in cell wall biosynthesis